MNEVQKSTSTHAANVPEALLPPAPRRLPGRFRSYWVLARADLASMSRSWLVRGFLLCSAIITVLQLKGMQANKEVASRMLESVYTMYLLVWMHGVIFIAGSALAREQDCLSDGILSRGITRGEYIISKLLARTFAVLFTLAIILAPSSFWAIRQDKLVRTDTGFLSAKAEGVKIEAWEPKRVYSEIDGPLLQMELKLGDKVEAGQVLALIDDRKYADELDTERRSEADALTEVENAHRKFENAKRTLTHAEDALASAERAVVATDLFSRLEQEAKGAELRMRKRELKNAENDLRVAEDAITKAERAVENARTRLLNARKRLSRATITAPISGYITELPLHRSQNLAVGTLMFTIAPLDEYELRVPIYEFKEFKRLKEGLQAFITIQGTEYKGSLEKLGAMTEADKWGRIVNYATVRFKGDGTLGMLGLNAAVRISLPAGEQPKDRAAQLLNTLTGRDQDDLESRTASVTTTWMIIALAKVLGCATLLVTLTLFLVVAARNALLAILGAVGLWHISNLIFDFGGLPNVSYLEIVRTMDKVLGGIAGVGEELAVIGWLAGITLVFAALTVALFVSRDPPR
jgi:multidrug resistance efflux pump